MVGESNYAECVVKKKGVRSEALLKGFLIAGIGVMLLLMVMLQGILQLVAFAAVIIFFILVLNIWPKFYAEYEYIFVDGQIDFDVMYSSNSRKHLKTIDMEKVEIVQLYKNYEYKKPDRKQVKYISGDKDATVYSIILHGEQGSEEILFEPDENFLSYMKRKAPRKVYTV